VLSVDQLQAEIALFWAELGSSRELSADLKHAGFNEGRLLSAKDADSITVQVDASGADPASTLLIIALAPTANRVLRDLWSTVLLPRIQRRWGEDAIGAKVTAKVHERDA
jgi:hypothetical protein